MGINRINDRVIIDNAIASITVYQINHGFVAGDVVRCTASNTYTKSIATSSTNALISGIVLSVTDVNTFKLVTMGYVVGSFLSSLTTGALVYLSATTAGLMTSTSPVAFSKPIGIMIGTETMIAFPPSYNEFNSTVQNSSIVGNGSLGEVVKPNYLLKYIYIKNTTANTVNIIIDGIVNGENVTILESTNILANDELKFNIDTVYSLDYATTASITSGNWNSSNLTIYFITEKFL